MNRADTFTLKAMAIVLILAIVAVVALATIPAGAALKADRLQVPGICQMTDYHKGECL